MSGQCTVLFVFLCGEPHCNPSNAGVNAEKTSCEPLCCCWPGHGAHSDLELATTGHLVTLTPHRGLVTGISSQTSCGPASPGDLHTWATLLGWAFLATIKGWLRLVPVYICPWQWARSEAQEVETAWRSEWSGPVYLCRPGGPHTPATAQLFLSCPGDHSVTLSADNVCGHQLLLTTQ